MISDCILAAGDGKCRGLTKRDPHCGSSLCPFYKTIEQERESQRYCRERLAKQGQVFNAYYKILI